MVIAGSVGAYLGLVFYLTGNILVPIIAHTLYDIIAFAYTRVLVDRYQAQDASTGDQPLTVE